MAHNIRVDQDGYDFLKARAEPFADTPNSVLRRVLRLEGISNGAAPASLRTTSAASGNSRKKSGRRSNQFSPSSNPATGPTIVSDGVEVASSFISESASPKVVRIEV